MRLAEVIGALSLAADLSSGLPTEKGLRTVIVATRLARLVGVTSEELADVFWVAALRLVGCLGFAHEEASFAAGDDNSMRQTLVFADFDRPLDVVRRVVRGLAPEAPPLERVAGIARFALDRDAPRRHAQSTCETAIFFARSLGMADGIARSLDTTHERFDGNGPRKVPGDHVPTVARLVDVADVLELFAWTGGPDLSLRSRARATRRIGYLNNRSCAWWRIAEVAAVGHVALEGDRHAQIRDRENPTRRRKALSQGAPRHFCQVERRAS